MASFLAKSVDSSLGGKSEEISPKYYFDVIWRHFNIIDTASLTVLSVDSSLSGKVRGNFPQNRFDVILIFFWGNLMSF